MGTVDKLSCFDEASPCIEEQTSICVIDIAQSGAADDMAAQATYVPWHICKDQGKSFSQCHAEVGIDPSAVQDCMSNRVKSLIPDYISRVSAVHSLPHEEVNGKQVDADYDKLKSAFCEADSSLTACGGPGPTPVPPTPRPPPPRPTPVPLPPAPTPSPAPPRPTPQPSPTPHHSHYGHPPCLSDEEEVTIGGSSSVVCARAGCDAACPTDVPSGSTAQPSCSDMVGACLLKCDADSECPSGASCTWLGCMYPALSSVSV